MEKLDLILPYIMTTVILVIITVIIFRLFNFVLQRQILESGPADEQATRFIKAGSWGIESLKWGLLLLFGGLGLLVLTYLPYEIDKSPFPYGIEAIFLAMGFISYYLISRRTGA